MDNDGRPELLEEVVDTCAVSHVQFMMNEAGNFLQQPLLIPSRVALWAERDGALIIVHAVDMIAGGLGKKGAHF